MCDVRLLWVLRLGRLLIFAGDNGTGYTRIDWLWLRPDGSEDVR